MSPLRFVYVVVDVVVVVVVVLDALCKTISYSITRSWLRNHQYESASIEMILTVTMTKIKTLEMSEKGQIIDFRFYLRDLFIIEIKAIMTIRGLSR